MRLASTSTTKASKKAAPAKAAASKASSGASKATNSKYNTAKADDKGYFGRSVHYTDVHTSQLDTYSSLVKEMARKRLPQPKPKNYTGN